MSIYIFAEKTEQPLITIVKAEQKDRAEHLAEVGAKPYSLLILTDSEFETLNGNNEVLIR